MRRPLSRRFALTSMSALAVLALAIGGVGAGTPAPPPGIALERLSVTTPLTNKTPRPTALPGLPSVAPAAAGTAASGTAKAAPQPARPHQAPVNCAKVKCVALTFDDGPGPYTAQLLKHLEADGAKATFFLLGQQVRQHPELVEAQAKAGMELGNHSWDHPQLSALKKKSMNSQIRRTNQAIVKASGGTRAVFLRPPYGDLLRSQRGQVTMPLALWDVDTLDWKTRSTKATVRAAAAAQPGDIVLMHDIHESTVRAVPQIVKKLRAKGIHLVTLSTLMGGKVKEHIEYGAGLRPDR